MTAYLKLAIACLLLFVVTAAARVANPAETQWTAVEELDALLEKEPRPVVIEMYATWCGWCKKMDKTTFADPEVAQLLNEEVYVVKINGEATDPFTFLGKETNGKALRDKLGIQGYPTFVLLDKKQEKLEVIAGYKSPAQMKKLVNKLTGK